jgi:serine/threonine-protein kinase
MFRKTFIALALSITGLVGQTFADQFAAIAYSPSTGAAGWSYNYSDLGDAQIAATSYCNATDAVIVTWSRNAWCALAAADDGSYGHSWGNTQEEAEAGALANCTEGSPAHIVAVVFSGADCGG